MIAAGDESSSQPHGPVLPYQSPAALRSALSSRFKAVAKGDARYSAADLHRQFAYDRLLARVFTAAPEEWILKGAGALLARLEVGRHTKDVDLYWQGRSRDLAEAEQALRAAARLDLGDFFAFTPGPREVVSAGPARSVRVGFRALLGARGYARFHVDLVTGVRMTGFPETVPPLTPVDIPGLVRPDYRAYPLADHVADKFCAILETHHRAGGEVAVSSRYKDLIDLAVIAGTQRLPAPALRSAIVSEVARRELDLPAAFEVPDRTTWSAGYRAAARRAALVEIASFETAVQLVQQLLDPLLREDRTAGEWDPQLRQWRPTPDEECR